MSNSWIVVGKSKTGYVRRIHKGRTECLQNPGDDKRIQNTAEESTERRRKTGLRSKCEDGKPRRSKDFGGPGRNVSPCYKKFCPCRDLKQKTFLLVCGLWRKGRLSWSKCSLRRWHQTFAKRFLIGVTLIEKLCLLVIEKSNCIGPSVKPQGIVSSVWYVWWERLKNQGGSVLLPKTGGRSKNAVLVRMALVRHKRSRTQYAALTLTH